MKMRIFLSLTCLWLLVSPAVAVELVWDDEGGSLDKTWSNNGNWGPDNLPDISDDLFIGVNQINVNIAAAQNDSTVLDQTFEIRSLTLGNGADVATSDDDGTTTYGLFASTDVTIGNGTGSSVLLLHDSPTGITESLDANSLTIEDGGQVTLRSSNAIGSNRAEANIDNGLLDINVGGTLFGDGIVSLDDAIGSPTTLMQNDGTLSAGHAGGGLILVPPPSTLQITANDVDARLDLDGLSGNGIVNVFRNATLDIDVQIGDNAFNDAFNGTLNLSENATLDIEDAWEFSGAMEVNTPATFGFPTPGPGQAAQITGGALTMSGGTITLNTPGVDSLEFNTTFDATGGQILNSGHLIFNADATIGSGVDFDMQGSESRITVGSGIELEINDADFDMDSNGSDTNVVTIQQDGLLDLNLGVGADERMDGVININGGTMSVNTASGTWVMNRELNLANTGGSTAQISGNTLEIGNDLGANDAQLNVTGTGLSRISSAVVFQSDASVDIAAGAVFETGTATFISGNGANNAQFTGAGTWRMTGNTTFEEVTTINMVGGIVDLDNSDQFFSLTSNDVNINAELTINAATLADYGHFSPGAPPIIPSSSSEMTVDSTAGRSGRLIVNLDNPNDSWVVNGAGIVNLVNDNAAATLLLGSDVEMDGTLNITGDVRSSARLDIGGDVNINTAGQFLRLAGGNLVDTNRLTGGTISGVGALSADGGRALHGFGTINTDIDFNNSADLIADGGTMTLNGAILDVDRIGTTAGGVLNVTNPWATNVTGSVRIDTGRIEGATIINNGAGGIRGRGEVASVILNNTNVTARDGGTLLLSNANNDWDGVADTGSLIAETGNLELQDNATFQYRGTVRAANGNQVFANGFDLEFEVPSTLELENGTYASNTSTNFGGSINVLAGGDSTIQVTALSVFDNTSTTTLGGNLRLEDGITVVESGAAFGGGGALVNTTSHILALADGANANVLVENEGRLELGASPGQATVMDYQQSALGTLEIEIAGNGLNDIDRLTATGIAQLNGELELSLLGGFAPVLGDTFTILTAGSIGGAFSIFNYTSAVLDPGLEWDLLYNAASVQLQVIEDPTFLAGDYNEDGVVDAADYTTWRSLEGQAILMPNDLTPGTVAEEDFLVWRSNFGNVLGAGASAVSSASVPEPTGLVLMLAAFGLTLTRRRR